MVRFITATALSAALICTAVATAASSTTNRYGGPVYDGNPALPVTAALVNAGGGAGHFSIAQALTSMVGTETANAEVSKLNKQYGKTAVNTWITGFNFAVEDALKVAQNDGVRLPSPAHVHGQKLASALVTAGVDSKTHVYWSGLMYDKALSHAIHNQVMDDIDKKYGATADLTLHRITNQAMYDLARALGDNSVNLAPIH